VFENATIPGEATATSAQGPADARARSTLKPLSLNELSVHDRSIRVEEMAAAERLLGADGIVENVVVPARFE